MYNPNEKNLLKYFKQFLTVQSIKLGKKIKVKKLINTISKLNQVADTFQLKTYYSKVIYLN